MTRFLLLLILAWLGALCPCHAEAAQDYKAVVRELEAQKQEQKELERKAQAIEREISSSRSSLIHVGQNVQLNEKHLRELETQIAELNGRKDELAGKLKTDRESIVHLVMALQKMKRLPPEAIIAMPGSPLETAQTAMLMQRAVPVLYARAEDLRARLTEHQRVSDDLEQKRRTAMAASKALQKDRNELAKLVEQREESYAETNRELKAQQEEVRKISMQAENLQDLVRRLDDSARERRTTARQAAVFIPKAGQAQLPITGVIVVRYGQPDSFGAASKGLSIEGSARALVVAPMGGVVRFAGPFKNYGQLIIMEHAKGEHSLIAGLQKIDTVVGQSIHAGEPLGYMGSAPGISKPVLYYELRVNGAPVNPARVFNLG